MVKPIDIAFSAVRERIAFKSLKALEKGIYVNLVEACILSGIDPLPTEKTMLQMWAGATSMQWHRGHKRALAAFYDTIEILKKRYQVATNTKTVHATNARATFYATNQAAREAKLKKMVEKRKAHRFSSETHGVSPMQYQKHTPERPATYDIHAVKRAKATPKSQLLTDKRSINIPMPLASSADTEIEQKE